MYYAKYLQQLNIVNMRMSTWVNYKQKLATEKQQG